MTKRLRCCPGGTSASKTISILLYLIARAQCDKTPTLTSVVAESFPHLRRGALRDFLNILKEHNYYRDDLWDKTNSVYNFETGSQIEFFSVDQPEKVRGARRDRLFINEANNIPFSAFEELEVRTKEFVFLDWNPTNSFWYYEDIQGKRNDVEELTLTYKDNEALDKSIIESIEQRKNRQGWWQVYGLGQLGEVEGKIYSGWNIIDNIPHEARLERFGLDFGYTNDPTAIVALYYWNGGYILDEVGFQKGLSNKQIADILLNQKRVLTIADSAEPKSIDEIKSFGVLIQPTVKGKDSVRQGIQVVQDQQISVTKRSTNIIKEYRNYLWATDREGKVLNEPEHTWSHCFAPETLIHTTKGKKWIDELVGQEGYLYSRDGRIERFYNVRPTRENTEVLSLTFNDGDILTVTPDHLLLLPNGQWIEAQLLNPQDMIQSVMYEARIQWSNFYQVFWRKILQRICEWTEMVSTPLRLVSGQWFYTQASSCPSQGREQGQQFIRKLGIETQSAPFIGTYDSGTQGETTSMGRKNKTAYKEVAWVKRGNRMAQVTWEENLRSTKTNRTTVFTLSSKLFYNSIRHWRTFLWSKLQDESKTKTIERIERGFRALTYNLEVENTHCLMANGVIAHNSMDAIRYAITSLAPIIRRKEYINSLPRPRTTPKSNIAV